MIKNKGSFWKGNIKKIKKERKERRIAEKVKISRMKIEKTVSNELQPVVVNNEETQQQVLEEEKEELTYWQSQGLEHCSPLLDANIIFDVFDGNEDVITKLKNYQGGENLQFLALDRIIHEFINVQSHEFQKKVSIVEVIEKLNTLGKLKTPKLNHNSELAYNARELWESEEYKSQDGVPLSETDCYLLEFTIENGCVLVTHDNALYEATKKEIRLRAGESEFAARASVFDPHRA